MVLAAVVALLGVVAPTAAQARSSEARAVGFKLTPVVSGLDSPVYVTQPAGDPRLFVVEQTGRIVIVQDGKLFAAFNTSAEKL